MTKKILFYGDIACDLVIHTEAMPEDGFIGHDARISDLDLQLGGSSANSAAVAATLGIDAYYMGFVGDDLYSHMLLDDLNQKGVKTDWTQQVSGKSTMIIALIDRSGERSMLSYRGVNANYSYQADFDTLVQNFDAVHISGYCLQDQHSKTTAMALVKAASNHKIPISIDPSFLSSQITTPEFAELLTRLDYIFPNRNEALQMTGNVDPDKQLDTFLQMGIRWPVLKRDKEGCVVFDQNTNQTISINAFAQANIVNAVGAGDAFCAGFLSAHMLGMSPSDAGKIGNAAAHIVLAGKGGRDHLPTRTRMRRVLEDAGEKALFRQFYTLVERV